MVHLIPTVFLVILGSLWKAQCDFRSTRKTLDSCLGAWMNVVKCFSFLLTDFIFIFHHAGGGHTFGGLLVDLPLVFRHKQAVHSAHSLHPFLNLSELLDKLVRII